MFKPRILKWRAGRAKPILGIIFNFFYLWWANYNGYMVLEKQLPVETTLLDSLNEIIGKLVEVQIFEIATRESKFDKYYLKKIIPSNYFDGDGAYYAWCKSNDLYGETLRAFIQNHVIEHHKLPTGVHIVPFNGDEVSIGIVDFDWLHELCQLDSP